MPFYIIRNDLTKVTADVIVNTANPKPIVGGGTDNAIYTAAGRDQLLEERKRIGDIAVGDIAVTPAFALDAKYIIHCVGPEWKGGTSGEKEILQKCYEKCMYMAESLECESIAFPLMASGVYGFPNETALQIAMMTMQVFAMTHRMKVYLVLISQKSVDLAENIVGEIEAKIDWDTAYKMLNEEYNVHTYGMNYQERLMLEARQRALKEMAPDGHKPAAKSTQEKNYQDLVYDYMNRCGYQTFAELGRKSSLDSKYLSKLMLMENKVPDKSYALALCIGMELTLAESTDLLSRMGLAFNPADRRDLMVKEYIKKKIYKIDHINTVLFEKGLKPLGSSSKL